MSATSVPFRTVLLAGVAAFGAFSAPALAEQDVQRDYLGSEIVVSAQREAYASTDGTSGTKTPTPLIDVPQAATIMTRDQLDDQNLRQLNDALRYIPGVSLGTGEGHRDQLLIRGQVTTSDFYLDGLRDDAEYYRPLYNVERIEVLKGANALIFGRGAGGGAINRVLKQASTMDRFGSAVAGIDTHGAWQIAADINAPLGQGIAGRLNATYEALDSNRQQFDGHFLGINPTLAAELGPDTRLSASYSYEEDERLVDRGLPSLNGRPLTGNRDLFLGDPDYNRSTNYAHVARLRLDQGLGEGLSANASLLYAHYDKYYGNIVPGATDGVTVSIGGYDSATLRENLIGQANLVGEFATGGIGHTLLIGVEAMRQDTDAERNQVRFATGTSVSVPFGPDLAVPAFTTVVQRASSSSLSTLSFYVQDQIELADWLQLIAGVRYEEFDLDSLDLVGNLALSRKDSAWSPRFGVVVKPSEAVSFYASYSESFLPQSGGQFTVLSTTTATLEPEEYRNYELGVKWAIKPDLFFTAALFQLDRSNTQATDPLNPGFVVLTGETRVRGFETNLAGTLAEGLNVSLGYTYLDGEYRTDTTSAPAGSRMQLLPEHQLALWGRYDVTPRFGLGLGLIHQSEQFASLSQQVTLPAYARVDAALYYTLSDAVSLQVNVENLLDKEYFASAHNDNNIQPGKPLTASFTLRTKF